MSFTGTEFTTSGLVNGDTIASVTLASDGAAATAHVSGSPYAITASDAVAGTGTELTDYAISYQRQPDRHPGRPDHHCQRRDQDLWRHVDLHRHRVHHQRPGQRR